MTGKESHWHAKVVCNSSGSAMIRWEKHRTAILCTATFIVAAAIVMIVLRNAQSYQEWVTIKDFKTIVPQRIIRKPVKMHRYSIRNISYDVERTTSLTTPYVGTISFDYNISHQNPEYSYDYPVSGRFTLYYEFDSQRRIWIEQSNVTDENLRTERETWKKFGTDVMIGNVGRWKNDLDLTFEDWDVFKDEILPNFGSPKSNYDW